MPKSSLGTNKISLRREGAKREGRKASFPRLHLREESEAVEAVNAQLGEIYMLHDRFVNGRGGEKVIVQRPSWEWVGWGGAKEPQV